MFRIYFSNISIKLQKYICINMLEFKEKVKGLFRYKNTFLFKKRYLLRFFVSLSVATE